MGIKTKYDWLVDLIITILPGSFVTVAQKING